MSRWMNRSATSTSRTRPGCSASTWSSRVRSPPAGSAEPWMRSISSLPKSGGWPRRPANTGWRTLAGSLAKARASSRTVPVRTSGMSTGNRKKPSVSGVSPATPARTELYMPRLKSRLCTTLAPAARAAAPTSSWRWPVTTTTSPMPAARNRPTHRPSGVCPPSGSRGSKGLSRPMREDRPAASISALRRGAMPCGRWPAGR